MLNRNNVFQKIRKISQTHQQQQRRKKKEVTAITMRKQSDHAAKNYVRENKLAGCTGIEMNANTKT